LPALMTAMYSDLPSGLTAISRALSVPPGES
jgi:hypothetical protein